MSTTLSNSFGYSFPAIAGVQAGKQFFVTMCPVHLIPKIFLFDEDEVVPELRAQRTLNRARVPEIARYILNNRDSYVFSALTASIDGEVDFETTPGYPNLGKLMIPMSARFVINDGQHRRAAIEEALSQDPDLGNETIAVVLFHDRGLERSQQMFADLNKYAIRPSSSIGVLYDHRDYLGAVSKRLAYETPVFKGLVEMEKTSLSKRSRKLFTLSAIYSANKALFKEISAASEDESTFFKTANSFWIEVGSHIREWQLVQTNELSASEVRQDYIHTHGITLLALGHVGNALLRDNRDFQDGLKKLGSIDWHRGNASFWEGRAMHNGKLSKSSTNVILTAIQIKKELSIPLTSEEELAERDFSLS